MYIINVTCAEIQTVGGFEFKLPSGLLNQTLKGDCDQSWYSKDGPIADPRNPRRLIDPAISLSSDRLVTSRCVNLNHEIICDTSIISSVTAFRVRNQTAVTPNSDDLNEVTPDLQHSDQLWWILSLLIVIVLLGLIRVLLCKRILRCFQRKSQTICQQQDDDEQGSGVALI